MKFTCTKTNFNNGINIALKAVPGKTTMPILECVVIEAKDGKIKMTTNDMQLGINTAEKLANVSFYFDDEKGELGVEII